MKETKIKQVHEHLLKYGEIDTWTAIQKYGATRLSSIIYNLRYKYDMNIINQDIEFVDRYGTKSFFTKYVYIKEGEFNE